MAMLGKHQCCFEIVATAAVALAVFRECYSFAEGGIEPYTRQ